MARQNKYATLKDLVRKIKRETGLEEEVVKKVVTQYIDEIKQGLLSGKQVRLPSFGNFQIIQWKNSSYYDPNTKSKVSKTIKTVAFKPSTKLKNDIKSG